jgi:nitrogenase molybdenum-iron protein alpha/beta subunit
MNPCPECGGKWIRNFVFDHDPQNCQLRNREDATHHADYERLQEDSLIIRETTSTELELLAVITGPENVPAAAETTVERIAAGIHSRTVNGVNPDLISNEATL